RSPLKPQGDSFDFTSKIIMCRVSSAKRFRSRYSCPLYSMAPARIRISSIISPMVFPISYALPVGFASAVHVQNPFQRCSRNPQMLCESDVILHFLCRSIPADHQNSGTAEQFGCHVCPVFCFLRHLRMKKIGLE